MSKRNPHPRFELYRRLRYQHQVRLTPNAMDTIEQFYHHNIKGSIYHVGMYRAINVVFAIVMLAIAILLWKSPAFQWTMTGTMVGFACYNVFHMLINVFQYKTIQEPEPFDEYPTKQDPNAYGQE